MRQKVCFYLLSLKNWPGTRLWLASNVAVVMLATVDNMLRYVGLTNRLEQLMLHYNWSYMKNHCH